MLDQEYDSRVRNLAKVVMKTFNEVATSPVLATMREDPTSSQYVGARVNEILNRAVEQERDASHKQTAKRLSAKSAESAKWRDECRRLRKEGKRLAAPRARKHSGLSSTRKYRWR